MKQIQNCELLLVTKGEGGRIFPPVSPPERFREGSWVSAAGPQRAYLLTSRVWSPLPVKDHTNLQEEQIGSHFEVYSSETIKIYLAAREDFPSSLLSTIKL